MLTTCLPIVLALVAAEPPESIAERRARARYDDGVEHFDAGRFDDAATAFEEAFALFPDARHLYNLALSHERRGDFASAADALSRYLARPDKEDAGEAAGWLKRLERRLRRTHGTVRVTLAPSGARFRLYPVGRGPGVRRKAPWAGWLAAGRWVLVVDDPDFRTQRVRFSIKRGASAEHELRLDPLPARLFVEGSVPGARVWLGGQPMGPLPVFVEDAPSGEHLVVVRAPGMDEWRRRVIVRGAGATRVRVVPRREPDQARRGRAPITTTVPYLPPPRWQTTAGWTSIGVASAAALTAVGLQLWTVGKAAALNDRGSPESRHAEGRSIDGPRAASVALYSASAVLAVAGAALLWDGLSGSAPLWVGPSGPAGLAVGGSF